ncbi:acyltransferase [Pararobbsia silviterrae]|uniref:Acyltransferase n=2 Tax=Pararobbsia silviterrae TaxID=1792498 RepID=A0A494XY66_9BURK|nr:acyltransferase [Pararobbsia silviterrae]
MVLVSHQYVLMGRTEYGIGGRLSFGSLAVCIFFVISGYLITQSWIRDPHLFRFLVRRWLRIWPALAVVTCIAACVVGPYVSTLGFKDYYSSPQFQGFFKSLRLTTVAFELPGVFENNPFPRAVNGSLWTIPLEVRWYLVLAVAGVCGVLRRRWLALAAFLSLAAYHFGIYRAETNPVHHWSNQYGLFFLSGALLQLFRDVWSERRMAVGALCILFGGIGALAGHSMLAMLIGLPGPIIFIGESSTPVLRSFGRGGDISYGAYIYAFLVQQTLVWKLGVQGPFAWHLLASLLVTGLCAWLSWHLVEKRALALKSVRPRFAWLKTRLTGSVDPAV